MKKRGGSTTKLIFMTAVIIMALMVGLTFLKYVSDQMDNTSFWRNYYAKDLAYLMTIGQTGRGELDVNYDLTRANKPLAFELADKMVVLYEPYEDGDVVTTHRYPFDESMSLDGKRILSSYFKLSFLENSIGVKEEDLKRESCPSIKTNAAAENITIYVKDDLDEVLSHGLEREGFNMAGSRFASRNLTIGLNSSEKNHTITFYYSGDVRKMDKLSCIIKNLFVEEGSEEFYLSEFKPLDDEDSQALIVSVKNPARTHAKAVIDGVKEYYG